MARTITQLGTNLEDPDFAKTGARPNHLSAARYAVAAFMHERVFRSFQTGGTS